MNFKADILPLKDQLFRLAFRITLNREDAEDIVQETLIRLWRAVQEQEVENIQSFGMTVCRNLALDSNEKRERRNISLDEDVHDVVDTQNQPDRLVESKERYGMLTSIIDSLPEKQRTAIQFRDVEGRSYKEIAEIMDISESDVKVNIFRARQRVKEKLSGLSPALSHREGVPYGMPSG